MFCSLKTTLVNKSVGSVNMKQLLWQLHLALRGNAPSSLTRLLLLTQHSVRRQPGEGGGGREGR